MDRTETLTNRQTEGPESWRRRFETDRFYALYRMGFEEKRQDFTASGGFLHLLIVMTGTPIENELMNLWSLFDFLNKGLFPTPKEISFGCSCPDWVLLCKHVAAALYGVGVRLDEQPLLFFELRGIDVGRFIDVTIANRVEAMLANEGKPSSRIIADEDIRELFGVL